MDFDLKLVDVINDPVALNQFLEFPVYSSVESHSLDEVVPDTADEDFLDFESCHLEYSSAVDGSTEWNFSPAGLPSDISGTFLDPSMVSAVGAQATGNVPVATLPEICGTAEQNLPVGYISASAGEYSTSHGFVQIQPSRNTINSLKQLPSSCVISDDSSIQSLPNANKVNSSFILNSAGSLNAGQVLLNVQPQPVAQNGAVHIQYVQVQNQLSGAVPARTAVQNIGAAQLSTNNLKQVQLQHQDHHGVQGGINLQGTIIPTAAGNRIVIRTGNQSVLDAGTGQVNMQRMLQIGSSNFAGEQDTRLPQHVQQGTSVQQGVSVHQPQMTGQGMFVTGQRIDTNTSISGGRHVLLQPATTAVSSQNAMCQQLAQQQTVVLPGDAIGSQDNKLPDGLVVQIGGQTYRFEASQQSSGAATNAGHGTVLPRSQGVGFGDGSAAPQDPVKMLQQTVHLHQMLIGNQINVLHMLQKQQQQQRMQPKVEVQQFTGSQVTISSDVINPLEVTNGPSGIGDPVLNRAPLTSQPLRTGYDPSLQWGARVTPELGPPVTNSASTSNSGLQFIQPKPAVSVGGSGVPSSEVVGQPSVNVLRLAASFPSTQTVSSAGRSVFGGTVKPPAQVVTTFAGGALQSPQNFHAVVNGQSGQSQAVTTVQLSTEQQTLLVKIQSQMKALIGIPKRNPDQDRFLQMLVSGQRRIVNQGVSQYLQQQKQTGVTVGSSGALGGDHLMHRNAVISAQPAAASESSTVAGNTVAAVTSIGASSTASVTVSSASSRLQSSGQVEVDDLCKTFPHLKEKLEAYVAKMSPEQRQWFTKNQSVVLAKLQHHHRLMVEQDGKGPPSQQHSKPPSFSQHQQNSPDVSSSSESTATRVIRSLHLTRAQKFHLYLQKDQKRATHPDFSKAFENIKDVIRGLVPYHVFQTRETSAEEIVSADETVEEKAREMLERRDGMLRKYRLLLMEESMRPQLTSEVVLLERAFHSDEKALLINEKRQAEDDPDSFVPRPVLKRLKVEEEDVKEEEEAAECKDEEEDAVRGEKNSHPKVETVSPDEENLLKLECTPCPSSPPNARPLRNPSSVERHKSLQIKLEKLDDTDAERTKCPFKIVKLESDLADDENFQKESKNSGNSESSEFPSTATIAVSLGGFTEDDVAVASLLVTERSNDASRDLDTEIVNVASDKRTATFDKDANALSNPANSDFDSSLFVNVADLDSCEISNEWEPDAVMQGTIENLMADLTQFNYDLDNSSWGADEPRDDVVHSGGVGQTTVEDSLSRRHFSAMRGGEYSAESLHYEMQCAIDSIVQLQEPWSGVAEVSSTPTAPCSRVGNEESGLGGCFSER